MIKINEEFFRDYINQLINQEINFINYSFSVQRKLYSDLLSYLQNASIDISPDSYDRLKVSNDMLKELLCHINSFKELLSSLENMRSSINLIEFKVLNNNNIEEYNKLAESTISKVNSETLKIQNELISWASMQALKSAPVIPSPEIEAPEAASILTYVNTESTPVPNVTPTDVSAGIMDVFEANSIFKPEIFNAPPANIANDANTSSAEPEAVAEPKTVPVGPIKLSRVKTRSKKCLKNYKLIVPISSVKIPSGMNLKNYKLIENTLIVSELTKTITLPYTIHELKQTFKKGETQKFTSLREVIKTLYVKPLNDYKNSSFARFREGYTLMRKREEESLSESFSLGFELFSNYNLHPAVIASCKDLNQLDIYLSCLEYNELDDFPFFKVVFNVAPVVTKTEAIKKAASKKKTLAKRKKAAEKDA